MAKRGPPFMDVDMVCQVCQLPVQKNPAEDNK